LVAFSSPRFFQQDATKMFAQSSSKPFLCFCIPDDHLAFLFFRDLFVSISIGAAICSISKHFDQSKAFPLITSGFLSLWPA
jgi:hypothetical protein